MAQNMVSSIVLIIITIFLIYFFKLYRSFSRNLAAAKSSGIPYLIVPIYLYNVIWMVIQKPCAPYLHMLPHRLTDPWLDYIFDEWTWTHQYAGFRKIGHDTFLTVSPGGNVLISADAAVISQICARGRDFLKPLKMYQSLNIYGVNVLTTEGQVWRRHRKITSPPFNERNNRMVFAESLRQAQAMTDFWIGEKEESPPIFTLAEDALRLSLHVISLAGFGNRLSWPVDEGAEEESMKVEDTTSHELSYAGALTLLVQNFLWLIIVPRPLLSRNNQSVLILHLLILLQEYLPFKTAKFAYHAYVEWGKYLKEMLRAKKEELASGKPQEGLDIMGAMIRASLASEFRPETTRVQHEKPPPTKPSLSDSEILGNSFVIILAGHETAANSIHFSLIYLALRPSSQRRLQADLDSIFGSRPVRDWNYERDFHQLFSGMCGAVLAEELRLIPPVIDIPKTTAEKSPPMSLTINGKIYHVPPKTYIKCSATGVHRNPAYWPTGPPTNPSHPAHPTSNTDNDLEEFKPERWLLQPSAGPGSHHISPPVDGPLSHESTPDTSAALFRPVRGAYIPFSDGQRACLGRRFAQVEILTVLAVIFKEYSVELAVDEFSTSKKCNIGPTEGPEATDRMGEAGKREAWEQAAAEVRRMLRDEMGWVVTMQLRNGRVPLRLVRRGRERFWW